MADRREKVQAEELSAVLDATETFLRVMASSHLPYDSVVRIERAAVRTARALLEDVDLDLGSEALLAEAILVSASPSPALDRQQVHEPLVSDEEPTLQVGIPPRDQLYADELATEEAAATSADEPSWVSFEEAPEEEEEEIYIAVDEPERPPSPAAPSLDPTPSFVSFDDPPDYDDEEGETQILTVPPDGGVPTPIDYSGVDADTLITSDSIELEPLSEGELEEISEVEVEMEPLGEADLEEIQLDEVTKPGPAEEVETFDLIPELTDEDLSLEEPEEDDDEDTNFHAVEELRRVVEEEYAKERSARPDRRGGASVSTAASRPAVQVGAGASPGGLYGRNKGAVPTIRDGGAPRPRAAAVQLNATAGTGQVMGLEEEAEPIEIGSAEDYGEEELDFDEDDGGGFRLEVQEYEDDLEPYEDEAEDEEVVQPAPPPPPAAPVGPSAAELAALFARAKEAAESGDMQRGTDLFSDVIDADPEHIDAYVGRGRLYLDLGDYSRAMSDFMVAEDMAPENPEPQIAIGDLYFARKDYRKAIDYFNAALAVEPNHAMAFCRRGISHYYRKNYRDSLSDLQRAQELDPDIPNIGTYITMARKKAKR